MLIIIFDIRIGKVNSKEYWHAFSYRYKWDIPHELDEITHRSREWTRVDDIFSRIVRIFRSRLAVKRSCGKRGRKCLQLCGKLSSILLRRKDRRVTSWILFHRQMLYVTMRSRWKVTLLLARIASNLKEDDPFQVEVMCCCVFQAKCRLDNCTDLPLISLKTNFFKEIM